MLKKKDVINCIKQAFGESKRIVRFKDSSKDGRQKLTFETSAGTFELRLKNVHSETLEYYAWLSFVIYFMPLNGKKTRWIENFVDIIDECENEDELYTIQNFVDDRIDDFEDILYRCQSAYSAFYTRKHIIHPYKLECLCDDPEVLHEKMMKKIYQNSGYGMFVIRKTINNEVIERNGDVIKSIIGNLKWAPESHSKDVLSKLKR